MRRAYAACSVRAAYPVARASTLALLVVALSACSGSGTAPMVQAPLFRRAGQVEGGLTWRPTGAGPDLGGVVRAAVSDHLRAGGSVSAAGYGQSGRADTMRSPGLYTDGFFGAEWGGWLLRFGALVGSGFGEQRRVALACAGQPARTCRSDGLMRDRYVHGYGQLHLGIAPPGLLAASLALRVPVVVDLADEQPRRATR